MGLVTVGSVQSSAAARPGAIAVTEVGVVEFVTSAADVQVDRVTQQRKHLRLQSCKFAQQVGFLGRELINDAVAIRPQATTAFLDDGD
jgi:hypothetical protein